MRLGYVGVMPVDLDNLVQEVEQSTHIAAQAAPGTSVEFVLCEVDSSVPLKMILSSIVAWFAAAITHSAVDYLTFQVFNRKADGTGTDVLASFTSNVAADVPAYLPQAFTIDSTKLAPTPGSVLTLKITKSGAGQAIPNFAIALRWR